MVPPFDRGHHDIKERIQNATSFCFGQFMLGSQMLNQFMPLFI